jgi:1-deoxy-D-xylulose-5-phosphate reductoisomerase
MKKISILGSTGSIGRSTLEVVRNLGREKVQIVAMAAHSNIDLLEQQVKEFSPELIAVFDEGKALELQKRLPKCRVVGGLEGVNAVAAYSEATLVMSAMTGTMGLVPTVEAIKAKKTIALANKEALVSGGAVVMSLARQMGVEIIPVDSEHSAIFQCLSGERKEHLRRIIITASGGPFRTYSEEQLSEITPESALKHPTWNMGPKITIDCSTLMNKGLEVIEAHWLFDVPISKIDVVIHPQSIIHSMVEFIDGSMIAQMSQPTMLVPIQYAITYPERANGIIPPFDFFKFNTLQFYKPDFERFRCLDLAFNAVKEGMSLPCFMNAANEVLVRRFLDSEISWLDIGRKLESLMEGHSPINIDSLEDVLYIDDLARCKASEV